MSRPVASLSLDLDNKWSYMKTHGDTGWEAFPSYLDVCVPRALEFLKARELSITFFVVGQDAALEQNREVLATIPAAGHEVGNHSFHHEPWLHLYSDDEIREEFDRAEKAIEEATGVNPVGFRGPGFSLSPSVLQVLSERGYAYDCSTFPTFLGPLARLYYFFTSRLDRDQKEERKLLFGRFREGLRPLKPYFWSLKDENGEGTERNSRLAPYDFANSQQTAWNSRSACCNDLLEIPVTTMPLFKVPIHVSYLLYLATYSRSVAVVYWRSALTLCRMTGVAPSLLLHPLDFLGCDDEQDLSFFPAMNMPAESKLSLISDVLESLTRHYDVRPMIDHALSLANQELPVRRPLSVFDCDETAAPSIADHGSRTVPQEVLT